MKTIIYSILVLLISVSSFAQNTNQAPFIGVWTWQDGNNTFTVDVSLMSELSYGKYLLKGNFKMEETIGSVTTLIYTSRRLLGTADGVNYYVPWGIFGDSSDGILFGASVTDEVLVGDGIHTQKRGSLGFTIQNSCASYPITATWKVNKIYGHRSSSVPRDFSIPTDIVLTKQ